MRRHHRLLALLAAALTLLFALLSLAASALGSAASTPFLLVYTDTYAQTDLARNLSVSLAPAGPIQSRLYWSPDGQTVAVLPDGDARCGRNGVTFIDATTGRIQRIPVPDPDAQACFHPAWSPDGAYLAFEMVRQGQTANALIDLQTLQARQISDYGRYFNPAIRGQDQSASSGPRWSPDGRYLIYDIAITPEIPRIWQPRRYDTVTGAAIDLPLSHTRPGSAFWRSDGQIVFVARQTNDRLRLSLMDPDGGRPRDITPAEAFSVTGWVYPAPDGDYLAFRAALDRECCLLGVVDTASGAFRTYGGVGNIRDFELSWSPDSRFILFAGADRGGVNALDVTPGIRQPLPDFAIPDPAASLVVWWSPDSRYAALRAVSANFAASFAIYDVPAGLVRYVSTPRDEVPVRAGWSADSRYLFLQLAGRRVRVFDVQAGAFASTASNPAGFPLLPRIGIVSAAIVRYYR